MGLILALSVFVEPGESAEDAEDSKGILAGGRGAVIKLLSYSNPATLQ